MTTKSERRRPARIEELLRKAHGLLAAEGLEYDGAVLAELIGKVSEAVKLAAAWSAAASLVRK